MESNFEKFPLSKASLITEGMSNLAMSFLPNSSCGVVLCPFFVLQEFQFVKYSEMSSAYRFLSSSHAFKRASVTHSLSYSLSKS